MRRLLHVVQESTTNPRHEYLGSVKDTVGHAEYFAARQWEVTTIVAEGRSDSKVLESVRALDLATYQAAFFELPLYPKTQRYLRKANPAIRILVRPINAEFLHQLHLFQAHRRYPYATDRPFQLAHDLLTAVRRLWLDVRCAWGADMVLSISEWETRHYWRWLIGSARVRTLPYFTPDSLRDRVPAAEKEALCVCPLSTASSIRPFPLDGLMTFRKLVRAYLQTGAADWRFVMTGSTKVSTRIKGPIVSHLHDLPGIESLGFLDDPYTLLSKARAVAVLSNFGYGVKTKILDAIAARCWVLVLPGLYQRLPAEVQPYCQVVPRLHIKDFSAALARALREPYPSGDPNELFRRQSGTVLDELLEHR